ncbi:GPGG-motif small membrane protein [Blastococcus haudaquaticus]|uniref:Uncharacterized protein n=1 Tax=Blastococcus haudaquaticus TaxID=1938745 RepID=A0A286GG60_9ACTN|nr:GPGG-motif small membrane protein [Blastococcus haudaquaticus]SOD94488.1 hypothetical protein SAMN06272739_0854 [Blastococcus haudaquaticus]
MTRAFLSEVCQIGVTVITVRARRRQGVADKETVMDSATLLWILAVILVVAGIFALFRRQMLWGIVLIVAGLLVGPGGVSVFT